MSESTIAIVGSGIVGALMAYRLAQAGHDVTMFEKGPDYPYPHGAQFRDHHLYYHPNPAYELPRDLKRATSDGIPFDLDAERYMRVGGSATAWEGICVRMTPEDFRTRSLFGYGQDWPITYDDLEPYYGQAEVMLGVSGTDDDNPFAPPRSTPYPLPPFDLAHDDRVLAGRLAEGGIRLHTTPQARTREAYDGRAACINFGTCRHCPIGARYSPNHHLNLAVETGRVTLIPDVSVRRIVPDPAGQPGGTLIYRRGQEATDQEHRARVLIVAAGALESARLLLLSREDPRWPDGVGNTAGQVGAGLAFHHVWSGRMRYDEALYPGRLGGWTAQSLQFVNPATRGSHGGLRVEYSSRLAYEPPLTWATVADLRAAMAPHVQWRQIVMQAESAFSIERRLMLSSEVDRYGDALAHVLYRLDDWDHATYDYARGVFDQFVAHTRPAQSEFPPFEWYNSGSHHMGGVRMGSTRDEGVVDSFGEVFDAPGVFVVGGSNFVGSSGALNPTLTIAALALRSVEYVIDQRLSG